MVTGRYAENAAFNPSLPALQTALNFAYLNDKKLSDIERIVMAEKALKLSHKTMAETLLSTINFSRIRVLFLCKYETRVQ
ncbi:cytidine/deoxycytidine deaminase [Haemophilus influenzae]|uniref:Cytidine/deoxycytidine deaminase n=1 Tax=Haemophilus influenzae TaxID=727 RepID=A0A2X1PKP3_HAEIF|nr:cytidine/deoxycytidine deaminase [Haemophilus influenzae]